MSTVVLAANNGDIGGGEVMLLACAAALRDLGVDVEVVGPQVEGGVLDRAADDGFPVHRLDADRRRYMARLRRWSTGRNDWLWCHGLVPSVATTGRRRRIVHLHQAPAAAHRVPARAARHGAAVVLVPSISMARAVPGAEVLWNWTGPVTPTPPPAPRSPGAPLRVGFLGRLSVDKGVDVLADAIASLERDHPGGYRLVVAGDARFVPPEQQERVEAALARVADRTDVLGWVERSDFFGAVDVAVFPSTWDEPFGLVLSEAMSARVPAVVSDAGALPEVAGPDHPWVVPRGDVEALAAAVRRVGEAPPAELAAVLDTAHARWSEHFSPEAGRARVGLLAARLGIVSPDVGTGTG